MSALGTPADMIINDHISGSQLLSPFEYSFITCDGRIEQALHPGVFAFRTAELGFLLFPDIRLFKGQDCRAGIGSKKLLCGSLFLFRLESKLKLAAGRLTGYERAFREGFASFLLIANRLVPDHTGRHLCDIRTIVVMPVSRLTGIQRHQNGIPFNGIHRSHQHAGVLVDQGSNAGGYRHIAHLLTQPGPSWRTYPSVRSSGQALPSRQEQRVSPEQARAWEPPPWERQES